MTELDRKILRRLNTERPDDGIAFLKTIDFKDLLAMKFQLKQEHIDSYTYAWSGTDRKLHYLFLTVERINKELRRRVDAAE